MSNTFEKITVQEGDELMDIVREISSTKQERILISFTNNSDILVSPINLRVLGDITNQKESTLILQIFKNPTGIRNANLAGIMAIDSPNSPTEEMWVEASNMNFKPKTKEVQKVSETSSFEERINSALSRGVKKEESVQPVESNTDDIVFDQDMETEGETGMGGVQEDLTKVDFKQAPKQRVKKDSFLKKINLNKIFHFEKLDKSKITKLLPRIVIPAFAIFLFVGFLYYYFSPYAKVQLYVESKEVSIERVLVGDSNIKEVDFEALKIPIKEEIVTKSVSDNIEATGVAYRGEKATGSVTIHYINAADCTDADEPITLAVGQKILNATESKRYSLTNSITITCGGSPTSVSVEAVEVGEEYNISGGKYFSVDGYPAEKVYGVNPSAFTGGSSTQYTVLSQKDVNDSSKSLEEIAKEDALRELNNIGDSWEIIDSTITSTLVEGSIKTEVPIGSEANTVNIELEVEAKATFYYNKDVDTNLQTFLATEAINQGLFDDDQGFELVLTDDIEKELTVEEGEDEIRIKITASSSVQPKVDREKIIEELRGMKWVEGNEYLESLSFISEDPIVSFTPSNFPEKLRYFPKRQGRISVSIN